MSSIWACINQAYAARLIGDYFNQTGVGKRNDVLAGHTARGKAKSLANLCEAGGLAIVGNAISDEGENGSAFWG
jgi:hypothetical protein